jgi:hypothetical protein
MVGSGPELVRLRKGAFGKALLIWDHHGSGWEGKRQPQEAHDAVVARLEGVTWKDHAEAVVIVPELEEWLWYSKSSLRKCLGVSEEDLGTWVADFSRMRKRPAEAIAKELPRELLDFVFRRRLGRGVRPREFENIAGSASLNDWSESGSFGALAALLRAWFPPQKRS